MPPGARDITRRSACCTQQNCFNSVIAGNRYTSCLQCYLSSTNDHPITFALFLFLLTEFFPCWCPCYKWWHEILPATHSGFTGCPAFPGQHSHTWHCKECLLYLPAQSQCGRGTRRQIVTWGKVDRAAKRYKSNNRTRTCCFVQGGIQRTVPR